MTPRLRELAATLLTKARLPALLAARVEHERSVARLAAELEQADHRVSIWDRALFFHDSPDQKEVARLEEALATAQAALEQIKSQCDQATRQVWVACPPVEIAHRVESVIASTLTDWRVGRDLELAEPMAVELDALAERAFEIWAPGAKPDRVAQALLDDGWRAARAGVSVGAPRVHETLGWLPITEDELAARAAAALESGGLREVRAVLQREASEYEAMAARLEGARVQLEQSGDTQAKQHREHMVSWLEAAVDKEHRDVVLASETELHTVELAFGSYPPLAIAVAARAAAGALRAGQPARVFALMPEGRLHWRSLSYLRAFFLAALVELRRVTEVALPGLPGLLSGRAASKPVARPPGEDAFFAAMQRSPVRALVRQAVAHATMIGTLDVSLRDASPSAGWLESLTYFSRAGDDRRPLSERRRWHWQVIQALGHDATNAVAHAAGEQPLLRTSLLVAAVHRAVRGIHTPQPSPFSTSHRCSLQGVPAALSAIDHLGQHLSHIFGPVAGRDELVTKLVEVLQRGGGAMPTHEALPLGYTELIAGLAAQLRNTDFVAAVARVEVESAALVQNERALFMAGTKISVWDQAAFWSKSDAEREYAHRRTEKYARMKALGEKIDHVNAVVNRALAWYPPADLYYRMCDIRNQVANVGVQYFPGGQNSPPARCELIGYELVLRTLDQWTQHAIRVFGPLPSPCDLLERWVVSELA